MSKDLKAEIASLSRDLYEEALGYRRWLHQNPELSFHEEKTAEYILEILHKAGLEAVRMAENGVVAVIHGKAPGKVAAIRADMDALPLNEKNELAYKSVKPGIMHACGHDFHMATVLGTAFILQKLKNQWKGAVKLIFQPAEEKLPGGALHMIEEGALANPDVNFILGQHVEPELPTGTFGFKTGPYMASSDEVIITMKGQGGHAAMPWKINDTITATAHLIVQLQSLLTRSIPAEIPTILSFGKMVTPGGALNVIPPEVIISGTFRTFDESWRTHAHQLIRETASSVASSFGCRAEVEILKGYPVLINNEELTHKSMENAINYFGNEHVVKLTHRLTAEDFAYYAREIPAVFYRIGTGNKDKKTHLPLHSPHFNVDEEALIPAMEFMTYNVINLLNKE